MINKISSIFRREKAEKAAFSLLYSVGKFILYFLSSQSWQRVASRVLWRHLWKTFHPSENIFRCIVSREGTNMEGEKKTVFFFNDTHTTLQLPLTDAITYFSGREQQRKTTNGGWLSTSTFTFIWRHCKNWLKKCSHENFIAMNLNEEKMGKYRHTTADLFMKTWSIFWLLELEFMMKLAALSMRNEEMSLVKFLSTFNSQGL